MSFSNAFSQHYFINNYSVESGLPTSFIYDVVQDTKGRMWFATAKGISIFDGFLWQNLGTKDSVPNISYRKLFKDEKGVIWALPVYLCEPMMVFDNDKTEKINLPEAKHSDNNFLVTSVCVKYENDKPVVYIGSFNGIYIYKNGKWEIINSKNGLLNDLVISVSEFGGKFYIVTRGGVSVYCDGKVDNSLNDLFKDNYSGILLFGSDKNQNSSGKLWALGNKWLGYIENNNLKIVNENFLLPNGLEFEYPSMSFGKNNLIYFGNFYYTYYYNLSNGDLVPLSHKQGFMSDGCTQIYVDREDNLWKVGTRGIDKANNLYLLNYGTDNGLQENEVSAIYEYSPGKIILGHNNGITFFDNKTVRTIEFKKSGNKYSGDFRILDICGTIDGTIWLAGSSGGVGKMDLSGNIRWIRTPGKNYVSSIAVDKDGVFWIATDDGIFCSKGDVFIDPPAFSVRKQYYRRVFILDDEMYFASNGVLVRVKNNKVDYLNTAGNGNSNNYYSVYKNNQGKTFVGTKDGLYIFKEGKIEKYNENGFVIDAPIYSIIQDKSGNYWFGTDAGVIKWDGKNTRQNFLKANGLSGLEVNRAALKCTSDGSVWIGTESGLTCYKPDYENHKIPVPEILFVNAEDQLGEKYPLTNNLSIKSNIKSLFFIFRGMSFYNESYIHYKVKLEGFDADWMEISQQQLDKIRYTNLKPGDYKLFVSAKNISGEWSEVYSSGVITIEKPYYRKWWFIILFIGLVAFFVYIIYRLYLTRVYYINLEKKVQLRTAKLRETEKELRNAQAFLETKVKERTEKLAVTNEQLKESNATKDKFFSIIAHDLKSPFVGLIGYSELLKNEIDELDKDKIKEFSENLHKNIKSTYNLLENLLNWALLQTHRMSYNAQRIDLYLEVKSILDMFDTNARTKDIEMLNEVNIDTALDADKNMLRSIIYNLVSNAIKYTNPGGKVRVYSKYSNGNIEIFVSDNGIGMDKPFLDKLFKLNSNISTKGTAKEKGTGLGLILSNEMVEMHKGKIKIESEPGKGTTFCVILPRESE